MQRVGGRGASGRSGAAPEQPVHLVPLLGAPLASRRLRVVRRRRRGRLAVCGAREHRALVGAGRARRRHPPGLAKGGGGGVDDLAECLEHRLRHPGLRQQPLLHLVVVEPDLVLLGLRSKPRRKLRQELAVHARHAREIGTRVGLAAASMRLLVLGEQSFDVRHGSLREVSPPSSSSRTRRWKRDEIWCTLASVISSPTDSAVSAAECGPNTYSSITRRWCAASISSSAWRTHCRAKSASPSKSTDGSRPHTSSSPWCSLGSSVLSSFCSLASHQSAMRLERIVCSQERNSPTDLPSNADTIALAIASAATSSASASLRSLSRARFTRLSQ